MKFVFRMMNFALKMMGFVFKMMKQIKKLLDDTATLGVNIQKAKKEVAQAKKCAFRAFFMRCSCVVHAV